MADRPYVLLSCGMSMDGYIDSVTERRLALSNDADFDRVDAVRAESDAILVGAATVRNDNPRLIVRSARRRRDRVARGQRATPIKVTLTGSGKLEPGADFFAGGDAYTLVYCVSANHAEAADRLSAAATVIDAGAQIDLGTLCADLHRRGVRQLMVEGGGTTHTQFLTADLVDELHLVVAPLFVGDSRAQRFVNDGAFPWHPNRRAKLAETRQIGDVVLLRYALSSRFEAR